MDNAARQPTVEIALDALCANYRLVRAAAPGAECAAVVKCDAYGLGAVEVARALAAREGCATFFVAYPEEGAALRRALGDARARIYVLNGTGRDPALLREWELTPVLNNPEDAAIWAAAAPGAPAALHIDTGMNRLGCDPGLLAGLRDVDGLSVTLVMSHLACASDPAHPMNAMQRSRFEAAAAMFRQARRSLAASAGVLAFPAWAYDLVRPGVALYGANPFDHPRADGAEAGLKPVARLTAPVLQMRDIDAGESVGYGADFRAPRAMRLATVALGYGDGFLRAGGGRGAAILGGARAPIVGRISMDLITLDASAAGDIAPGARAEFFGPSMPIEAAAAAAGTAPYELLTGLGPRVRRIYRGHDASPPARLRG
jgi:alanine racemase